MLGNNEQVPDAEAQQVVYAKFTGNDKFTQAKEFLKNGQAAEALALLW